MALPDYSGQQDPRRQQLRRPLPAGGFRSYLGQQGVSGREYRGFQQPRRQNLRDQFRDSQVAAATPQPTPPPVPPTTTPQPPMDFTLPPLPPTPGAGEAPPQNGIGNPFYDPNSNYIPPGSTGNVFSWLPTAGNPDPTSPGNVYANENPEGYYYAVLNQRNFGGLDARSRAAQSMYGDYARGYQAAKFNNPELGWAQYIGMQDIPSVIQMLSDEQLGIDRNQYRGALNWTLRG